MDKGETDVGREAPTVASILLRRILTVNHEVEKQLGRHLEVNNTDLEAMQHMMQQGPLSPTELARLLMISTAAATSVVDRLVKVGHVARRKHPDDRRRLLVVPTKRSMEQARSRLRPIIDGTDALLDSYSPQQQGAIVDFLSKTTGIMTSWLAAERDGGAVAEQRATMPTHDEIIGLPTQHGTEPGWDKEAVIMTDRKMNDGGMNDGDHDREDQDEEGRNGGAKEARVSRGGDEVLATGEVTKDAKGLGAVFGDADRTYADDPVKTPGAADTQAIKDLEENFTVYEHEGQRYVEENPK
ncbi:MarR family transcriptional regulator [Arthrobacter sp. H14-L1]|nr:MarR family transcriptional regulator [Arthrobacter sp. H14-L1]